MHDRETEAMSGHILPEDWRKWAARGFSAGFLCGTVAAAYVRWRYSSGPELSVADAAEALGLIASVLGFPLSLIPVGALGAPVATPWLLASIPLTWGLVAAVVLTFAVSFIRSVRSTQPHG